MSNSRIEYPQQTVLFPVISNICYIIPSILLFKRGYMIEFVELLLLVFFSSAHHLCNPSKPILSYCINQTFQLSLFDDLYSLFAIINCCLIYYKNRSDLHVVFKNNVYMKARILFIYSTFILYLFTSYGSTEGIGSLSFLYCILIVGLTLVIKYGTSQPSERSIIRNFRLLYIGGSICFVIPAIYLKLNDSVVKDINEETNMYHFALYHSLWHGLSAGALIMLILAVPIDEIKSSDQNISIVIEV
jgi:hypothetical protein